MAKAEISREKIVETASAMLREANASGLQIRTLAARCGVSVGSVYNYFPTKAALEIAAVESIWNSIFHPDFCRFDAVFSFTDLVRKIYAKFTAEEPVRCFFLSHRNLIEKSSRQKGKDMMERYFVHIKTAMQQTLCADTNVNPAIWSAEFTRERFVSFVFYQMLFLLSAGEKDCDYLVLLIEKLIYRP